MTQADIGYVHAPDLINLGDLNASEQIRVDLVIRVWFAGIPRRSDRHKSHPPHQCPDQLAANRNAKLPEPVAYPSDPVVGVRGEDLINAAHQLNVGFTGQFRFVVKTASVKPKKRALMPHADLIIYPFNHGTLFYHGEIFSFFLSQSTSTCNCPMFLYSRSISSSFSLSSLPSPWPNKLAVRSLIRARHVLIWVG